MDVLRSTWEHQHRNLVLAKGECGKYPEVSVEYFVFFHSRVARADVVCATFRSGYPIRYGLPLCGSLRHRARDPANVAFSNLRSHLLVYSNRLRSLCYAALAARPPSNDPTSHHVNHHTPLYFHPICFSSSLTLTQSLFSSYSSRHLP